MLTGLVLRLAGGLSEKMVNAPMRMWEVEDNKAAPSNLVREQDFILRIRRLHRLGLKQLLLNVLLTSVDEDYRGRGSLEEVQQRLQTFAESTGGSYAEMSGGDIFLIWPESVASRSYPQQVMNVVLPEGSTEEDSTKLLLTYRLPDDYGPLRERANDYVEASRNAATEQKMSGAAQALEGEFVRGSLTAWTVTQIEKLLGDISIRRYIRRQPIYVTGPSGKWMPVIEECFVALNELHRTYFPKIDLTTPDHLFLELCQALDRRLITGLTRNYEMIKGQSLSLNLTVTSVMEASFTHFSRMLPPQEHSLIGFEIPAGDLFQDMQLTLNAIATLKREGYRVAIDGITPDMLRYINFSLFDVDAFKINVSKEHTEKLTAQIALACLTALPKDKLIFFHCDSRPCLDLGRKIGIKMFQGWLIDDMAREESKK